MVSDTDSDCGSLRFHDVGTCPRWMLVDRLSFYPMFNTPISVYVGQLQDIMTFGGLVTKGSVTNSAILLQSWDAKDEIRRYTCKYESNITLTMLLMGRRLLATIFVEMCGWRPWHWPLHSYTCIEQSRSVNILTVVKSVLIHVIHTYFFYVLSNVFIYLNFANRIDEANSLTCILDDLHMDTMLNSFQPHYCIIIYLYIGI